MEGVLITAGQLCQNNGDFWGANLFLQCATVLQGRYITVQKTAGAPTASDWVWSANEFYVRTLLA